MTASFDDTVRVWDVAAGRELHRYRPLGDTAIGCGVAGFSPDQRLIATGCNEGTVLLLETVTGREVGRMDTGDGAVMSLAFSADGGSLLTGGWNGTALWHVASGRLVRHFRYGADNLPETERVVSAVTFSPDGRRVLTGDGDGYARLWRTSDGTLKRRFQVFAGGADAYTARWVTAVAFSHDGRRILAAGSGALWLWDGERDEPLQRFELGVAESPGPQWVAFLPGDREVALLTRSGVVVRDVATGQEIRRVNHSLQSLASAALSPDGRHVAAGSYFSEEASRARALWLADVVTGEEVRRFGGDSLQMTTARFSPDGERILTVDGADGRVHLWDLASSRRAPRQIDSSRVKSAAFSPDGRSLLTGGSEEVCLWDLATGNVRRFEAETESVVFSPDGRLAFAANRIDAYRVGAVRVWEVATGQELGPFRAGASTDGATSTSPLALSSDGRKLLARVDLDLEAARLWDVASRHEIGRFSTGLGGMATLSPDGKQVLTTKEGLGLVLWDAESGERLHDLETGLGVLRSLAFSPDGRWVAAGGYGQIVYLWNAHTGDELRRFVGHTGEITSIDFSPDGRTLLTASADHTVRFWNTTTGVELARLIALGTGTWVVATPEGRFDTNDFDAIGSLHWIMPDAPSTPLPIEIFMRDYYESRLLARALAGEKLGPIRPLADLNRAQPVVEITGVAMDAGSPESVAVTVEVASSRLEMRRRGATVAYDSGIYDLRLFRNGRLVASWPGEEPGTGPPSDGGAGEIDREQELARWRNANAIELDLGRHQRELRFEKVKIPRRSRLKTLEFSAYAFNADRVKSATARQRFEIAEPLAPLKGRATLVTVGVNAYENPTWDLSYAAEDARRIGRALMERLKESGDYAEVVWVPLIADAVVEDGVRRMVVNDATKARIKAVIDLLAGRTVPAQQRAAVPLAGPIRTTRPEDLVLISFSTHGHLDSRGNFHLFPSDIGPGNERAVSPALLSKAISSTELSSWLRDVDSENLVLIIDACYSAATVQAGGFKPGPMGSRGLGQLSYDKGMRILAASQAEDVALESDLIRQGLLSYALISDGLDAEQADFQPRDGGIFLGEWLRYGVERVPDLYREVHAGRLQTFGRQSHTRGVRIYRPDRDRPLMPRPRALQQPSLFDFLSRDDTILLAPTRGAS